MGIHLEAPRTAKHNEEGEASFLSYGLASMQGWRTTMEDTHAAIPHLDEQTSFFGVYDGHGGLAVSNFCAKHLAAEVLRIEKKEYVDLDTAVSKSFLRMDEMMQSDDFKDLLLVGDKAQQLAGLIEGTVWFWPDKDRLGDLAARACGSTACVAVIRDGELIVANAGDSRCIISRNAKALDLSNDHKPDLTEEIARIKAAGGFIENDKVNGYLNLTRAIGHSSLKEDESLTPEDQILSAEPEMVKMKLSEDVEFIVLASGIWQCMSSQDVVDFVHQKLRSNVTLPSICDMILDHCLPPKLDKECDNKGCDNMTVILVHLTKEAVRSAEPGGTNDLKKVEQNEPSIKEPNPNHYDQSEKLEDSEIQPLASDWKFKEAADEPGEKRGHCDVDEALLSIAATLIGSYNLASCWKFQFDDTSLKESVQVLNELMNFIGIIEKKETGGLGNWKAVIGEALKKIHKQILADVREIRELVSELAKSYSAEAPTATELAINENLISIRYLLDFASIIASLVTDMGQVPQPEGKALRTSICGFVIFE